MIRIRLTRRGIFNVIGLTDWVNWVFQGAHSQTLKFDMSSLHKKLVSIAAIKFKHETIRDRIMSGPRAARALGLHFALTKAKVWQAKTAMLAHDISIAVLGILPSPSTAESASPPFSLNPNDSAISVARGVYNWG